MTLEVTVQVALVRELKFVDQLLKTLVSVHEIYLQLNNCEVVYNLLGVLSTCALAHGVQVTGRNHHLVGIELHRPVIAEMVREQCPEFVEQLVLATAQRFLCQGLVCLADVLYVE